MPTGARIIPLVSFPLRVGPLRGFSTRPTSTYMKYIFLCLFISLIGAVTFLIFDDGASFPLGGPTQSILTEAKSSGDLSIPRKDPFYMGYRASNEYRLRVALIGMGISVMGALGWVAIRKAESSNPK